MIKERTWWLFWVGKGRWITLNPYIYYPKGINPEQYPAIIAHERIHLIQQANCSLFMWIIDYITNRKFRFDSEVAGIAVELSITKASPAAYAKLLCSSSYLWAAKNEAEAHLAITNAMLKL